MSQPSLATSGSELGARDITPAVKGATIGLAEVAIGASGSEKKIDYPKGKLRLLTTMKQRISSTRKSTALLFERSRQWLISRQQAAFISAGVGVMLLLLTFSGVTAAVAAAAAWIALLRHFAQTDSDRRSRITESYSKAVEQLASDKIEIRLGGIYTLERISRESSDNYWTVMETLCAFVRERTRWKVPGVDASETLARFYTEDGEQKSEKVGVHLEPLQPTG